MISEVGSAVTREVSLDDAGVNVALVLDGSESARDQQNVIASLGLQVIASLPAGTNCTVFFLGNPAPHPARELERNVGPWFDANERRASLIGPVLRGLATDGPQSAIAIIGSGTVFDLEDWIESFSNSHCHRRLVLLPVEAPLSTDNLPSVSVVTNVDKLVGLLHDPIVKVEIATPGMVPLQWSNSAYRLALNDGQFHVLADAAESFDMRLTCDASGAIPEYCAAERRSGGKTQIVMTSCRQVSRELEALLLTKKEAEIFEQAIRRKPLTCPHCAQVHSWDTVYCHNTSIPKHRFKGAPLYPTLEDTKTRGLVVFRQSRENVSCDVSKQSVLRISPSQVLALLNKKPQLLDYEPASSTWSLSREKVDPYMALADGCYVLNYR